MTPEVEFESTARIVADTLGTDPPPDVESLLRSRLKMLETRMEAPPDVRTARRPTPRRWFLGATALATISAAVLVAISFLPFGSTSAVAQIVEAVAAKKWLHAHGVGPNNQPVDMWFSATNGVLAWHSGESSVFVDQTARTMDVYGPPAPSGAVQRLPLESPSARGIDAARKSFLALLTGDLQRAMKSGDQQVLEQTRKRIVLDGRALVEHRFVVGRRGSDEPQTESLLTVDPQTGLPGNWQMRLGNVLMGEFELSYPETGPLTIAALGVPDSAPIIDLSPRGDFRNVLVITNAARSRFDDYHAIVIDSPSADRAAHGTWCQIWRKGNRWRIDRGHRMFHTDEVPPPGANAETWWLKTAKSMRSYPREIFDGKRLWTFEPNYPNPRRADPADPHAVAIDSLTASSRAVMDPEDPLSNAGVTLPEYYGYESLNRGASLGFRAETRSEELNGIPMTVVDLFRTTGKSPKSFSPDRYWLDPQRGFLMVRKDHFLASNPEATVNPSEVLTTARTPQGLWYPTTVRHIGSSISLEDNSRSDWYDRYYLEFPVNLPEELFRGELVDTKNFWTQAP